MDAAPTPRLESTLQRLQAVDARLWELRRSSDLHEWIRRWIIGLGFLVSASASAGKATDEWTARADQPDGVPTGPALDRALAMIAADEVVAYHELALVALSQPLLEALATAYLGVPMHPRGLPEGQRTNREWPKMAARLDGDATAPRALVAATRLVEVTFGTGRDRLVAHVVPGSIAAHSSGAVDAPRHTRGRIFFGDGPTRDQALMTLRSLNARLAPENRSTETNIFELGRDLMRRAGSMPLAWGQELEGAAVSVGFQLDFSSAAAHLVELLEAVAGANTAQTRQRDE